MTQMEPQVDCSKTQTLLSDLLDVRRGEQPSPLESPLGNPRILKAVEQHVEQCDVCKKELRELEEVGLAFSEFNIEEPEAAHFAGYGRMVNGRVRRMTQRTIQLSVAQRGDSRWRTWLSAVAASAAAAVLAVVLLGHRGETAVPAQTAAETQHTTVADKGIVVSPNKVEPVAVSESSLLDELVGPIDVPKLDPRRMDLDVRTLQGGLQRVTLDPRAEKKSPVGVLSESSEPFFLADPPMDSSRSTGLVGIMFKATGKEDPADGLCVVAVKRGGPADAIGLRPDDRLLAVNGVEFTGSTSEEIIKFFNAVSNLGGGKPVQVDYATKDRAGDWIVKRGRGVLGRFQ